MARNRLVVFGLTLLVWIAGCHPDQPDDTERVRVAAHLDRVAEELAAAPTGHLDPAARVARSETLAWLDEYRAHGVFPHNHVVPGERVPVFVDPHGTPCAVGYLLLRSGEVELVEEIVRTDNLVRVPELADDPRLAAWLDSRGLTLDEAAAIQPVYGNPPPSFQDDAYGDVTIAMTAATAAFAGYTLFAPRESRSEWVGVVNAASVVGHGLMLAVASEGPDRPNWAVGLNTSAAVVSVFAVAKVISDRVTDASTPEPASSAFEPTISHGPNGLGLGFTLRH